MTLKSNSANHSSMANTMVSMVVSVLILMLAMAASVNGFTLAPVQVQVQAQEATGKTNYANGNGNANRNRSSKVYSSPSSSASSSTSTNISPAFRKTDCDDINTPPSLSKIQSSIHSIKSGSDIRGTYIDHSRVGSILNVSYAISSNSNVGASGSANASASDIGSLRPLTPFAAFCYGAAFAKMVQIRSGKGSAVRGGGLGLEIGLGLGLNGVDDVSNSELVFPTSNLFSSSSAASPSSSSTAAAASATATTTNICIGRDPRPSGIRIADAFCRGVESIDGVKAKYTDLATTPSMFAFCRSNSLDCDGGVMVTASHLPEDKNGLKFFTRNNGGLTKADIEILADSACAVARSWYDLGILPQTSGYGAVYCSQFVNYMPLYMNSLRAAIYAEVEVEPTSKPASVPQTIQDNNDNNTENETAASSSKLPLDGLRIVLNAGNGAGYFFNQVLQECGANVSHSIHLNPDGTFPEKTGVPNPEYQPMMEETIDACRECNADIGIMLDTDADRCGFIVPSSDSDRSSSSSSSSSKRTYEALNRNRLIALLGVIFSSTSPGCTIVTDSVTSEGLEKFLQDDLGLNHVRYLKGYANVIGKAKELTESGQALAEVAIETSGHCAMRENGYLDDGTYTAVKVVGLLARLKREHRNDGNNDEQSSLLSLISNLEELDEVKELRFEVGDGSLETTKKNFFLLQSMVKKECEKRPDWALDEDNLEGVRVRTGNNDGGFFMLRVSLHDPIISLQIEAKSVQTAVECVARPLIEMIEQCTTIEHLDIGVLRSYAN